MADPTQCLSCGAVLLEEDLFCGECGSPRPAPGDAVTGVVASEAFTPAADTPSRPVPLSPGHPAGGVQTGWRVAAFTLLGLGVLACVVGLLVFFVAGSTPSEGFTTSENWLFSAGCCLLPIAGAGVLFAAAGAAIWYRRLKND